VDIQPDTPPSWGDADPGLWENVVCDVQSLSLRRGAAQLAGLLTQTEAGTVSIVLSDTERRFDPMANADTVHKGTPLRVRAWGTYMWGEAWEEVLWTGEVDSLTASYHPEDPPTVHITGVDLIGVLAAWEAEGRETPVGAGDTLRERAQLVMTEVARGTLSPLSNVNYAATLAPVTLARPWDDLQAAVIAELGRLWVDSSNRLLVHARGSDLAGPVRGTLSDVHDDDETWPHCCISDAAVAHGWETAGSRVLAKRQPAAGEDPDSQPLVRRDDVASQARYGVGVIRAESLPLEDDVAVADWAHAVINAHGRPRLRVDQVTPAPSPVDLDSATAAWPAVCATDLGDRWLFRYHPAVGPAVRRAVGVLGIAIEVTPEEWRVTWTTGPAPSPGQSRAYGWFILNESVLNSGDTLSPYGERIIY
jgi:hypothetical protein